MLSEFIESNGLIAELISFSTETPVKVAIKNKKFNPKYLAQSKLYLSKDNDEILVITDHGKDIDIEKLETISGEELIEVNNEECLERTGYKKEYLPPISIYGVRIIIDAKLEHYGYLIFPVGSKKYLKIPLEEILSYNDEVVFEKLSE